MKESEKEQFNIAKNRDEWMYLCLFLVGIDTIQFVVRNINIFIK